MIIRNVDYTTFKIESFEKHIICVGAGKMFYDMMGLWESDITERVKLVADKCPVSNEIVISDVRKLKLIKTEQLCNEELSNAVLLVTSMYANSIIQDLNTMKLPENLKCYIYPLMSMKPGKITCIPKVIHYCWFGKNKIPEQFQKYIDTWKQWCPDYQIVEWNESNYDIEKNVYMKTAYEQKRWGFVPDYARLDIIYNHGGIYLDTDVEICKSFDDLLNANFFCGFQRNFFVALGLGFGAVKHNAIIKEFRNFYDDLEFNLTPSPSYQTKVLKKHGLVCNNTFQNLGNGAFVYPTDFFDPQGFPSGIIRKTENTHSIHHYSETWVDDKSKNMERYSELKKLDIELNGEKY